MGVENEATPQPEDFAQLLERLKSENGDLTDSEVAKRIGVSVSAVNTWVHRKRAPRADAIRAIHAAFPKYTEDELFAAAGRKTPGPVSPVAEERLLELFRGLTKDQQEAKEIELRALNEHNRSALS